MTRRLTPKQEEFAQEYVRNGGNAVKAALHAYDTDDYDAAGTIAYENMGKASINERISELAKLAAPAPAMIAALHGRILGHSMRDVVDDQGNIDLVKAIETGAIDSVRRITRDPKSLGEKLSVELYDMQRSLDSLARIYGLDSGRLELDASDKLSELLQDAVLPWQSVQDAQPEAAPDAEEPEDEENEAE